MYASNFKPYYKNSWALVVGINEYDSVQPLAYARNDAESFAAVLKSLLKFPEEQILLLCDKEATKENILTTFLDFTHKASDPDDRLLFFFAGHGTTKDGYMGEVGYLVPVNGNLNNLTSLIRWDDLTRNADLIPAKHILFILDACFSGLALKRAVYPSGVRRFLSDMLSRRSRQVITAGKADQVVADGGGPQGKNSIFTGHLLEGLSGAAVYDSGILTANGIMNYVYQKLINDPKSEQTPHYGHIDGDGDFILIAPDEDLQEPLTHDHMLKTVSEQPGLQHGNEFGFSQPKPSFAAVNGYENPQHPSFGRNSFSEKLGTFNFNGSHEEQRAFSWLGVVVEPISVENIAIDLSKESEKLKNGSIQGNQQYERFNPPQEVMTTISSVILYDRLKYGSGNFWKKFVRIEKSGNLEFCDSLHSFLDYRDMRAFNYVQIIGMTWQFMFFAKRILEQNGYHGGVRLLFNLVGTMETILYDFSQSEGQERKHWVNPGDRSGLSDGTSLLYLKCPDPNLQTEYKFVLENLNEQSSKEIIVDIAKQLGLAYNHQSEPRCFNFGTTEFPWQQFYNGQRDY
jgi:hypothetical protein